VRGVNDFLEFAFNNGTDNGKIRCPCTRCANGTSWVRGMVHAHLINYGICQGCTCWYAHGEQLGTASSHHATNTPPPIHDGSSGMLDMLHEVFPIVTDPNVSQSPISEMGGEAEGVHENEGVHEDLQSTNQGTEKFYEFLNDAKKPLNDLGQPIGNQSGKFSNFASTLVRDKNIMPIDYTNWKKVPNRHKEDAWNLIQV
jgi:hypothetical protein